jgi:ankyrin repeat protein
MRNLKFIIFSLHFFLLLSFSNTCPALYDPNVKAVKNPVPYKEGSIEEKFYKLIAKGRNPAKPEEALKIIEQYPIDPNICDPKHSTPLLFHAVHIEHFPLIEKLLEKGADPNSLCLCKRVCSDTPLHEAATTNFQIVQLLIDKGSDINKKNSQGFTSLDRAVHGHIDGSNGVFCSDENIILTLLQNNADPNRGRSGSSLSFAIRDNSTTTVKMLFSYGLEANTIYTHEKTNIPSPFYYYKKRQTLERQALLQAIVSGLHKNNKRINTIQKDASLFNRVLIGLAKSENVLEVASTLLPVFPKKFSTDAQAYDYLHSLHKAEEGNVPSLFNKILSTLTNSENVQEVASELFQCLHPSLKNDNEAIDYLRSLYRGKKENFDLALKKGIPIPPLSSIPSHRKEKVLCTPSGVLLGALTNLARYTKSVHPNPKCV